MSTNNNQSPNNNPTDTIFYDPGTGTSLTAYIHNGKPKTISTTEGTSIPSQIFLEEDGTTVVGTQAGRLAHKDPSRFLANFKTAIKQEGEVALTADGKFTVVDAFAALFRHLFLLTIQHLTHLAGYPQFGGTTKQASDLCVGVTIPAVDFGMQEVAKYRKAMVQAGFPAELVETVKFFKEPYAAAHAALAEHGRRASLMNGDILVIFDAGGGTFDISTIEYRDGLLHTKAAHAGLSDLGGSNLTAATAQLIGSKLNPPLEFKAFVRGRGVAFDADGISKEERADQWALWPAAEDVKHQLHLADKAYATVSIQGANQEVIITLDEAQAAWEPLLSEIDTAILDALGDSGLTWNDVKFVVLAGGASRTRGLRDRIASVIGRPVDQVLTCAEPQHSIVEGAVIMGHSPADVDTVAMDAWGLSYPDRSGRTISEVYIENGQNVPAAGLDVERATTVVRSQGQPSTLTLYPFIGKASVLANVGDLLKETEVVPLKPVQIELDLPTGEHPVLVRFRFDVTQTAMAILSFPTVPGAEAIVTTLQIDDEAELPQFAGAAPPIVLLVDSSTSMEGPPMQEVKDASCDFISNAIAKGSEVTAIDFGGTAKVLFDFTKDENFAREQINALQAGGGTDMSGGLSEAELLCVLDASIVVLFSDGYPYSKANTIAAAKRLVQSAELYTIPIGKGADVDLLADIASSPQHTVPIGRAADLDVAFSTIETLIYTGEQSRTQLAVVKPENASQASQATEWEDDLDEDVA